MALTPGGGPAPTAPPPPRPARDGRDRPPGSAAALRALRWGLLVGGLLIIVDLSTRLIIQRAGQDAIDVAGTTNQIINVVLLLVAGTSVQRETGRIVWAIPTGLLAGLLDGLVIAAANTINPAPFLGNQLTLLLLNVGQGLVVAFLAAVASSFARRRRGS